MPFRQLRSQIRKDIFSSGLATTNNLGEAEGMNGIFDKRLYRALLGVVFIIGMMATVRAEPKVIYS